MNPYEEIAEFFVEAIIAGYEQKWRQERIDEITEEDKKIGPENRSRNFLNTNTNAKLCNKN